MRRLFLLLFLPLLLLQTARADNYSATKEWLPSSFPADGWSSTQSEACQKHKTHTTWTAASAGPSQSNCTYTNWQGNAGLISGDVLVIRVTCPYGGTLAGNMCENAPPCTAPQVRNATTGACEAPPDKCASKAGTISNGWYIFNVGATPSGANCVDGCTMMLEPDPSAPMYYTNGKKNRIKMQALYTGASCTGQNNVPPPQTAAESPPEPPKEPECSPGEGVLTSSTGKVHCVPSGVPDAPKPKVEKNTEVQNFPDGSKKSTDTTKTTDIETGVTDVRTKTTTSGKPDGSPGQAGTPGTSTGSSSSSTSSNGSGTPDGSGSSDFCSKNPGLQICKGGMNEETTQKKVLEAGEKIRDSLSAENFDPATHLPATIEASTDAKNKLDQAKDTAIADINKFGTGADPSGGHYQQFKDQMGGWLGEIPVTGCQPFNAKVGPYQWSFDHCEKALKIAEIFGYCLWVMLAFGVFSLATRNRGG